MTANDLDAPLEQAYLDALGARCQAAFAESEIGDAAISVHLEIETLAERAEAEGDDALSQAALDLSVFLYSLIESRQPANALARERIAGLCSELHLSPGRQKVSAKREPHRPLVIQMLVESNSRLDLAAELTRRRVRVERASCAEDLERLLAREQVLAILLDNYWLDHIQSLMQVVESAHPAGAHEPGYIALLDREDRTRRMFALRAGVDAVVESAGNSDIAAAVTDYLIERKRSAYKVLLVEDDRAQSLFVRSILAHRSIETAWAKSASEALTLVGDIRPDLILLDLHLPDINGIELAQQLRERPALDLVPIVFLSAEPSMEEQFRAMRLGGDAWISKPVKPRVLLSAVAARVERARRLRARQMGNMLSGSRAGMLTRGRLVEQLNAPLIARSKLRILLAVAPVEIPGAENGVDFVAQGKLAEEISQFLLAHALGRGGVCQPSPFLFLLPVDVELDSVERELDELRVTLSSVGWLSGPQPVVLPFALAATQVDSALHTAAEAIQDVQSLLQSVRNGTGSHCIRFLGGIHDAAIPDEHRAILASSDVCLSAMQLSFLPMLATNQEQADLFLCRAHWRYQGKMVSAIELMDSAIQLGRARAVDQAVLAACLSEIRGAADKRLTLAVPVALQSLEDERLVAWLRAELSRQDVAADRLVLWLESDGLLGAPALAQRLLRPAAEIGVGIAAGPFTGDAADLDLVRLNELSVLTCVVSPQQPLPPTDLARVVKDQDKRLVVMGVDQADQREQLRDAADYLCGTAVSAALASPRFSPTGG